MTEAIGHSVVLSGHIHYVQVKFAWRLVPPGASGCRTRGRVNMLLVPTLQTSIVGAHHIGLQTNMPGTLAQGADNGICLLFPCSLSAPKLYSKKPQTHAREARRPLQPRHKDRCQATHDKPPQGRRCQGQPASKTAHRMHSQLVAGPGRTPQRRAVGRGRAPQPRRHPRRQEAHPTDVPVLAPLHTKPARKSARCGSGDRSLRTHYPHPQPVGSGPQLQALRTGGRAWESAQPRTVHTQAGAPPPGAPSCRPRSVQSQLARSRAVGLVTGPEANTPRVHSQWVAGPGRTPQ